MKLISPRYFTASVFLVSALLWVSPGHTIELWSVEQDTSSGRLRAVIHPYSPDRPEDMAHLRKLVTHMDRYEIPSTDETPAEWLRFRYGPHDMLKQALGDPSTPPAVLSAYIETYRGALRTFLEEVVYADPTAYEEEMALLGAIPAVSTTASQAAPETATTEVQTDQAGAASQSRAAEVQTEGQEEAPSRTVATLDRFMARLKERLPVETRRIAAQAQAQVDRLAERAPIELARIVGQVDKQLQRLQVRAPVELSRLGEQAAAALPGKAKKELKRLF